jgi:hypothetical protein
MDITCSAEALQDRFITHLTSHLTITLGAGRPIPYLCIKSAASTGEYSRNGLQRLAHANRCRQQISSSGQTERVT